MLPDRITELLAAYVDGELPASEVQAVHELLARFPEAAQLLQRLQADAQRLRHAPRATPTRDLVPDVLQAIASLKVQPVRRRPVARPAPLPAWAGLAAAAAVLLVVSGTSYLYFQSAQSELAADVPLVRAEPRSESEPDARPWELVPPPQVASAALPPEEDPAPETPATPPAAVVQAPAPRTPDPESPPADVPLPDRGVLGTRARKPDLFQEVPDPQLALILSLRDLEQEKQRQRLMDELHKDSAYRLEIGCFESARAFEQLHAAFRAQGVRLVIDPDAAACLKLGLKMNYVLYTDQVTAEELTKVVQLLGSDDRKAETRRRGDGQFDKMIVSRMTETDHKELARMLGVDPTQLPPPRPRSPLEVDIRRPLAETTKDQVTQSLKGQGPPRPESRKASPRVPERLAVVLAYNPTRPRPASSKEVKQFLDARREARPGSLQMFLVLRGI